jgi:hypothetical protein
MSTVTHTHDVLVVDDDPVTAGSSRSTSRAPATKFAWRRTGTPLSPWRPNAHRISCCSTS